MDVGAMQAIQNQLTSATRPRRTLRRRRIAALAALMLLLFTIAPPILCAAIITYAPPPIVGTNVVYPAVSESSSTDPLPLYGTPAISGDVLNFANMNFSAVSVNATPAIDFTDGQINFTIQSKPGVFLRT